MKKKAISILFAILFTIALIYIPKGMSVSLVGFVSSVNGYGTFFSITVLGVAYAFYKLITSKYKIKFNIHIAITSLFLAFCLLIGKYYIHKFSIQVFYESIPKIIMNIFFIAIYYVGIYAVLFNLFEYCKEYEGKDQEDKELNKSKFSKVVDFILEKHSFIIPFLIILICGLPYIISFYPGTVQQDGNVQLQQFLDNYGRTGHHPYMSTMVLGTCFTIGSKLGNDNLGIFTFTMLQFVFSSLVFAYSIDFMKKLKAPMVLRGIALAYFAIFTIWPINAYTFVKDTIYYLIFLMIVIDIFKYVTLVEKQNSIGFNIELAILCVLLCMFRNNGVEVVLLTLFVLLFLNKSKKRIIMLICSMAIIVLYHSALQPFMYEKLEIEEGSIREAFAVPCQQMALTIIKHGDEIDKEDKEKLEEIINIKFEEYGEWYDPEIADPIKNNFEYYSTEEQRSDFFKIWFKYLFRHPVTYIDAYLNNFYGYFYPDRQEYKDGLGWYECSSTEQVDVHFNEKFESQRHIIEQFAYALRNVPLIGIFYSTGIYTWSLIVIFSYLMYSKKYKYLLILVPSILTLVVCCLSPVGAYIRYSQPIMANMPLLLCLMFNKK